MIKNEIALIFRSKLIKRFSIETLFYPIKKKGNIKIIELPYDFNSFLNLFKIFNFLIKIKQKVIHITGDINYVAIFLFWKKIIITVHDLNHLESLKGLKKIVYYLIWFRLPLNLATKIVVISPYTKLQLLKHLKLDEKKIIVIPNTFLKFKPLELEKIIRNHSFFQILCIGSTENKNIERLIESMDQNDGVFLRLIGFYPNEIIDKLNLKNLKYSITNNLNRNELAIEYLSSDLVFFASTKEGFGLPILEAQSLGIPVLTSNTTSMPYVAGDGAVIVDPYSVSLIREKILLFVNKQINLQELKDKGYANLERFSESSFIKEYEKVYNSIKI